MKLYDKYLQINDYGNVFHYTTLNVLKSIVENGEIWCTRVDYLNDKKEFRDFNECFDNAYYQILSQGKKDNYEIEILKYVKEHLVESRRNDMQKDFYNFSFSSNGDSIPMWNYYSKSTGISIEFNSLEFLNEIKKNSNLFISSHEVLYENNSKVELIKSYLEHIIEIANENINKDISEIFDKIIQKFAGLMHIGNGFKNESFDYEKEIKFIIFNSGDDKAIKVDYLFTDNNVKPYIKLNIDKSNLGNLIKSITISPLNNSDSIIEGLDEYLKSQNVVIKTIKKSVCPLRIV